MKEITVKLQLGDALRLLGILSVRMEERHKTIERMEADGHAIPGWQNEEIEELSRMVKALSDAI